MLGKGYPCPKCSKLCKSPAGLIAHIRLEHGEEKKKTYPDEIGKRLENIEAVVATTINPGNEIKTEEEIRKALELLLPAIEKYGLAVCCFEKAESPGVSSFDRESNKYRVVKNSQIKSFGLGSGIINVVVD